MIRRLTAVLFAISLGLAGREANAYPWMIRHEYANCATCHADPSGGGLITAYGRAQGELILRTHYNKQAEDEEPGRTAQFAFGVIPIPDNLLLEAVSRSSELKVVVQGAPTIDPTFIQMQSDLRGQLTIGKFRINGSVAYAQKGALPASITGYPENNIVSREHWIGFDATTSILVRAGRIELPFGVRNLEHNLWVRSETRTDTNELQQDGASMAWSRDKWRGELMAIAGNFQVHPDVFRERGLCGFAELAPLARTAVGWSSLVATSKSDIIQRVPLQRQAHGVFLRTSPWQPLVVLAEEDLLVQTPNGEKTTLGATGMMQLDVEPLQGVHLIFTGEHLESPVPGSGRALGYWATLDWFFASHADIRLDAIARRVDTGSARVTRVTTYLAQFHFYL